MLKASLKRWVFNLFLKTLVLEMVRSSAGREFHEAGPENEKAGSPIGRTTYVDAAYYYRPIGVVCRSVCHSSESCKNG